MNSETHLPEIELSFRREEQESTSPVLKFNNLEHVRSALNRFTTSDNIPIVQYSEESDEDLPIVSTGKYQFYHSDLENLSKGNPHPEKVTKEYHSSNNDCFKNKHFVRRDSLESPFLSWTQKRGPSLCASSTHVCEDSEFAWARPKSN